MYFFSLLSLIVMYQAIRALISSGAGSCSYTGYLSVMLFRWKGYCHTLKQVFYPFLGPTKLILFVKSPTLNLPLNFLLKHNFRYHKKVFNRHNYYFLFVIDNIILPTCVLFSLSCAACTIQITDQV